MVTRNLGDHDPAYRYAADTVNIDNPIALTSDPSLGAGAVGTTELADGAFSADASGRAKIATAFFDETTVDLKFAAAAIDGDRLKSGGVTGTQLSVTAATKAVAVNISGFNASVNKFVFIAPSACTIQEVMIVSDTATSGSDGSNKFDFQVSNRTQTEDLLSVLATTNSAELAIDVAKSVTPDQNATIDQGDVLEFQIVKTGTPTDLSSAEVMVQVIYSVSA
jgi:hypothetical protein